MAEKGEGTKINIPQERPPEKKNPPSAKLGGSFCDEANKRLFNDVFRAFWTPGRDSAHQDEWVQGALKSTTALLYGIGPRNETEGMFAAQMVAAHAASMECYRRAAIPEQSFEGREMNLKLAVKASRTFALLTESLQKLRGEAGKQQVHVHHHHHQTDARTQIAAQNAVVNVPGRGEGDNEKGNQPHERHEDARALAHDPAETLNLGTALRREEPARDPVPMPRDARSEKVQATRRKKPRRTDG